jgi:predicted DNA-binding transcriptional regulator AlpA
VKPLGVIHIPIMEEELMSDLLRTAQVHQKTGIPVATLRWWRHRGEGPPSFKLGKKTVVYPADQLAQWIAWQKADTTKGDVIEAGAAS